MTQCNRCNLQYIGETKRRLKDRFIVALSITFTYFRYYEICNIKITSQCKIPIVPEEGWFGQPK